MLNCVTHSITLCCTIVPNLVANSCWAHTHTTTNPLWRPLLDPATELPGQALTGCFESLSSPPSHGPFFPPRWLSVTSAVISPLLCCPLLLTRHDMWHVCTRARSHAACLPVKPGMVSLLLQLANLHFQGCCGITSSVRALVPRFLPAPITFAFVYLDQGQPPPPCYFTVELANQDLSYYE